MQSNRWMMAILTLAALLLVTCSETLAKEQKTPPAKVEAIEGSAVSRVILVERAAQRLGVQTAPIREMLIAKLGAATAPESRIVTYYSAVIYDLTGGTWVYTNPEPLVYVRQPIRVDYVQGDIAVLFTGPPVGTQVVVVGAAELYGTETGVR